MQNRHFAFYLPPQTNVMSVRTIMNLINIFLKVKWVRQKLDNNINKFILNKFMVV